MVYKKITSLNFVSKRFLNISIVASRSQSGCKHSQCEIRSGETSPSLRPLCLLEPFIRQVWVSVRGWALARRTLVDGLMEAVGGDSNWLGFNQAILRFWFKIMLQEKV